jgi:mono/diheme cytochrome c family protein
MRLVWPFLTLLVVIVASARAAEGPKVDFAAQVQPIFAEHCYQCHGPDKQESSLRLDLREPALRGGDSGPALVAGQSKASELVRRIASTDDQRMPPADAQAKPLTAAEIELIKTWIDQGAVWPEARSGSAHWSFQPIGEVQPPLVKNLSWVRNPVDRFVLSRLEQRDLAPSAEADRPTLIKRLFYDLVGLPPKPAEVDAFVNDAASDAYQRLVDRLLDSPHFGERWGRHWLDMARYADSDGYEKDNARPDAWRYRDWVIDAINADMPLDRFTIEQLAGDLLPGATPHNQLATAFHRQTLTNTEGGVDQEQFRVEAIFDRVATTGSVWLGLTVGCAQCHSHKYDPITHEEYYRLFAFFNNGDEAEVDVPLEGEALAKYTKDRHNAEQKLAELKPKFEEKRSELAAKLPAWESELKNAASSALAFHPVELVGVESTAGTELKLLSDGSYLATGKNPDVDKVTVTARTDVKDITGFRLETLAHDSLGNRGPGRTDSGNFVLNEFRVFAASTREELDAHRAKLKQAAADFSQDDYPVRDSIDNKAKGGWAISPQVGQDHWAVFVLADPIDGEKNPWLQLALVQNQGSQHTIGRFRLMAVTGNDPLIGIPQNVRDILALSADKRSQEQSKSLLDYYLAQDSKAKKLSNEVASLEKQVAARPVMKTRAIVQRTDKVRTSHVLHRGDFLQPAAEVRPGTPGVLPPMKASPEAANRLDLARWLVDPANPLVRRVMINHLWSSLFGRGLVRTPGDFGVRGERPTHPELLDWLAGELVRRGWSRKEMIRLIVSSATYRQSSHTNPQMNEVDPLNDLFHRQNRYRVEAEVVRDLALSAGGLLSEKVGGPSVFPPLPPGIAELSYAGNFKWNESKGEDRYRRGMYTFFKRTAPHPNLSTFDCPDSNTTALARQTSNTPLQALVTLNNESFVEAAQSLGRRVLEEKLSDDAERLKLAIRTCVARPATEDEVRAFAQLLAASRQWYAAHPDEAKTSVGTYQPAGVPLDEAAAWVTAARMALNLDEFLTRE